MTDLNDVIERLREIEAFGHGYGHGRGYTCADMAQRIIRDLEALRDEQPKDLPPT